MNEHDSEPRGATAFAADNRRFHIKPDYRPNLVQATYDADADVAYWSEARIASTGSFQYDVYRLAAELARGGARSVLDIGSGPPTKLARLLPEAVEVDLVDQPNTGPIAARLLPRATFTAANLETIDFDLGRRFDLVVCADVIEHLVDPDPCLAFARAHLAPAGRLLISTPERDVLRGVTCRASIHPQHVREWNRREFAAFLASRGFAIERHALLPQQRTVAWRRWLAALAAGAGHAPAWYSCQYALCRRA